MLIGWGYLQMFFQVEFGKIILQMDSEIHVLYWVHHNVNELHAGHLSVSTTTENMKHYVLVKGSHYMINSSGLCYQEVDVVIFVLKMFHQLFKTHWFIANLQQSSLVINEWSISLVRCVLLLVIVVMFTVLKLSNADRMISCPPLTKHTAASSSRTRAFVLMRSQNATFSHVFRSHATVY